MRVVVFASAESDGICRILSKVRKLREDGWEVVLPSLMLGPSPGARARGDHTMGGCAGHGSIPSYHTCEVIEGLKARHASPGRPNVGHLLLVVS